MFRIALRIYRWIFARPHFRKINLALFHMSLRGLGVLNYENEDVSGERYFINDLLPSIIGKTDPVIFDVGANVGNYTTSIAEAFPDATVHAFEPHPKNFARLQSNVPSSNVECHNLAVGEARGELTLYDRADHDGSTHASLYKEVISDIHKQNTVELDVSVETIDEFCAQTEIEEVDFIKVDTEGNELSVLKGAQTLIENGDIKCIHFEFNEMNVMSRTFIRDFRNMLDDYDLYRLLPNGVLKLSSYAVLTEIFAYQNIIAVRKDLEEKL